MKPEFKQAFDSALVCAILAGGCLWLLISAANQPEASVTRVVFSGLGLALALVCHIAYMLQIVRRSGRAVLPWFLALVLFMPVASAVLMVQLSGDE